jgi:hypothetical protein
MLGVPGLTSTTAPDRLRSESVAGSALDPPDPRTTAPLAVAGNERGPLPAEPERVNPLIDRPNQKMARSATRNAAMR